MEVTIISEVEKCGLSKDCITKLNNTFNTREAYVQHMRVLKAILTLLAEKMDYGNASHSNEVYPLFKTLNELYGAFLDDEFMKNNR